MRAPKRKSTRPEAKHFLIRDQWYEVQPDGHGAYAKSYAVDCKATKTMVGAVTRSQNKEGIWYANGPSNFHDLKEAVEDLVVNGAPATSRIKPEGCDRDGQKTAPVKEAKS